MKKLEKKHWVLIICVKRPSWAWRHFQGREKWRKRHGSLRKALNKRTRMKFYQASHRLKSSGVGSLGTGAGVCLRGLPRWQENTSQPKRRKAKPPRTRGSRTPPTHSSTSGTADPAQERVTPTLAPTEFQQPRAAGSPHLGRPSRACANLQAVGGARAAGNRASRSPGNRALRRLPHFNRSCSLPAKHSREKETVGFLYHRTGVRLFV